MDALRKSAPRLYRTVTKLCGLREPSGKHEINILRLPDFTRGEMFGWLAAQVLEPDVSAPVVKPAATPAVVWHKEPESIREALDVSKNEERRRVERQASHEDAFEARLREYERAGLEPTSENADKIVAFIKDHPQLKGYYSSQAADVAVAWLGPKGSNVLTWKPKEAPAPPPSESAEPTEVLGTLPDGTKQLPLDVDQFTLSRATKDQARDWLKRYNAGRLLRPRGSFISSF